MPVNLEEYQLVRGVDMTEEFDSAVVIEQGPIDVIATVLPADADIGTLVGEPMAEDAEEFSLVTDVERGRARRALEEAGME